MHKKQLLDLAIAVARKSARLTPGKRFCIAAVGERADGVRVVAVNHDTAHRCPTGHAEMRLLRKLTPGSIVAVARVRKDGTVAMARPCITCANALRHRGVKHVVFTVTEGG